MYLEEILLQINSSRVGKPPLEYSLNLSSLAQSQAEHYYNTGHIELFEGYEKYVIGIGIVSFDEDRFTVLLSQNELNSDFDKIGIGEFAGNYVVIFEKVEEKESKALSLISSLIKTIIDWWNGK
jgi:hypothetical protein